MIHSMTGFGEAQLESTDVSFQVEIRALNNRFLKTAIKLPETLAFAEADVEKLIRAQLNRGSVTYAIHMRSANGRGAYDVNEPALQTYLDSLENIRKTHSDLATLTIDLAPLLALPGVCIPRQYSEEETAQFLTIVKSLTKQALAKLQTMRADEGKRLLQDLQDQCRVIADNIAKLKPLTETVVENYYQRLKQRTSAMLAHANLQVDEEMLLKEVALFAERCDVNEELARLQSHLVQFEEVCNGDQQAGRRLDFLTQEMLREANTIASKANDARISQHVVEIKVAIDRLREQVQNIE